MYIYKLLFFSLFSFKDAKVLVYTYGSIILHVHVLFFFFFFLSRAEFVK